jgi:hypothetical protein
MDRFAIDTVIVESQGAALVQHATDSGWDVRRFGPYTVVRR